MLLQHSRRETEIAQIYGETDSYGISLVSQNYPFPFLVEQEERWHGAFFGNTTHGTLYCVFGSIHYGRPLSLSHLLRPATIIKPIIGPRELCNLLHYFKRTMLDKSRHAHEALAKYLSFLEQSVALRSFPKQLLDLFETASVDFPFIKDLVDIFGLPFAADPIEINFKQVAVHTLGKIIFNTELEQLYRKKSMKIFGGLRNCV